MHSLALRTEDAEHLRGLFAGAAEPVRDSGVELGHLARREDEVVVRFLQMEAMEGLMSIMCNSGRCMFLPVVTTNILNTPLTSIINTTSVASQIKMECLMETSGPTALMKMVEKIIILPFHHQQT